MNKIVSSTAVSERDKKLLIFLAVFLVVIGFVWFLIKPAFDDITQLNQDITTAQTTKNEVDYQIRRIPSYETDLSETAAAVTSAAADFYPMMESQEVDYLLTNMALNFGFQKSDLRQLTISMPKDYMTLAPYQDTSSGAATGLYAVGATFRLFGTREKIQPFIDLIVNSYKAIRLISFGWSNAETLTDECTVTLNLEIYMTDTATTIENALSLVNGTAKTLILPEAYLEESKAGKTTAAVSLYCGPDSGSATLCDLKKDVGLFILAVQGDWSFVEYGEIKGWLPSDQIRSAS